jgi:hypothetical protein
MNNKGISSVIATIVIIGISISAIAIVFPLIQQAIRGPMMSPTVTCSDFRTFTPLKMNEVCYTGKNEVRIKLARTLADIEIPSLRFSMSNNGKIRNWECAQTCGNCAVLQGGETKFYYLDAREPMQSASVSLFAGECPIEIKEVTPCPIP